MAFAQAILARGFNQVFDDNKRSVTLYRATRSESNITGSEQLSYADGVTVDAMFFKTGEGFTWDAEGLFEVGDFLVFDKADNLSLSKDDKIEADNEVFIIQIMHPWRKKGVDIFSAGTGAKLS